MTRRAIHHFGTRGAAPPNTVRSQIIRPLIGLGLHDATHPEALRLTDDQMHAEQLRGYLDRVTGVKCAWQSHGSDYPRPRASREKGVESDTGELLSLP